MAYNESAYQNLLFGVSQQAPQDRLPGQLDAQLNMTSDLVAGLRRRAAVGVTSDIGAYSDLSKVKQYNTDMGGVAVSMVVDTGTGTVRVVEENSGNVLASLTDPYLTAASARVIRMVTLDDTVWVCNVDRAPVVSASAERGNYPNPDNMGYFYVVAGSPSKTYSVTFTNRATGASTDISWTTPNGTSVGDAAASTPEAIAEQLVSLGNSSWAMYGAVLTRVGAYVTVRTTTVSVTLSSVSGSTYVRASNAGSIRDPAELPARLVGANGYIIATGTSNTKTYYRYEDSSKVWLEDVKWEDMVSLSNMPIQIQRSDAGVYTIVTPVYERRSAGDAKTNPVFKFTTAGITGMAAFQGRLVLLSNEYVCMSASDNPLRWFRSTLAALADNDPIEVAAQGSLTAPYEYALNFNKDLVLFSKRYQGIMPGSGIVTPRTANLALMTRYDVDVNAEPVACGRSMFFGAPRSLGYVGMHELTPSQYSDSQYVADDVTSHIPRYVQGPFRFIAASTTGNLMVAGAANPNELLVHEYLWSGAEKVHASWHKWTFAWPVVDVYFSGDVIVALFGVAGKLVICRVDLQRGAGDVSPTVARLDFYTDVTCVVPGELTVPAVMSSLGADIRAFKIGGANAYLGQKVFSSALGTSGLVLSVPEAVVGDRYTVGFPFVSSCTLTPAVIKDAKGVPITTSRAVLHRYRVSVANTGQFAYNVRDDIRQTGDTTTTPLRLYSQQLGAGLPLADSATVTIPARVDMSTGMLTLESDDYYDLNVRSVEYGFRYHQRFRRA
ncbi:putative tail tubular protein [Pseudomonas phage MR6]|uniref:Putative tail tubular protein n=1 Tax=Pseudomonas phage MR5 TaxID=2711172 RepID=A0A6M3TCQ8_9CAUD|nr:putative tail tubular protein [Pseudomonas phage MR5]QJD54871.1 putative tail tubular protein [Pseudomonas phage MR6]QJD54931.1 putative tail tubular protein [Pseudomonas phage MR7]